MDDYIWITDIATAKSDDSRSADVIKNWLRNRNTLEFLGTWETICNPNFKVAYICRRSRFIKRSFIWFYCKDVER